MKPSQEKIAAAAAAAAVGVVMVAAVVAIAAATAVNASHAGNKAGKRKKVKAKSKATGSRGDACFETFDFYLLPSYFLAAGVIFSFSRSVPRIISISYSPPAFI